MSTTSTATQGYVKVLDHRVFSFVKLPAKEDTRWIVASIAR